MFTAVAGPSSDLQNLGVLPEPPRSGILGTSVSIKGSVVSCDDLYIDGEVEGSIEATGSTVTVGPNARLAASITAREVIEL